MEVINISGDTIGYAGLNFEPSQIQEVSEALGKAMILSNPGKFQKVPQPEKRPAAPPTAKGRRK